MNRNTGEDAWYRHVRQTLVPKLKSSGAVVSIVPEGQTDVKFAVELGLSIMLDKPIIAILRPGTKIPAKLALVADRIIETDMNGADHALAEKVGNAVIEITEERERADP